MLNTIITIVLTVSSLVISTLLFIFWRRTSQISKEIRCFLSPAAKDEPSPAALLIDNISSRVGSVVAAELRASLMGKLSGDSRLAKGIEADIAQDIMTQQSPLLAGLAGVFPTLGKRLSKNPAIVQAIMPIVQNMLAKNNGNGHSQQVIPSAGGFAQNNNKYE